MEQYPNNAPVQEEEEEGIDIIGLIKQLWDGRKTILIWTGIFMVLGLLAAFTMKRTYTVSSTLVPQTRSRSNSSLSSLASMAGIDLGMTSSGSDLSPLVYPQIVSSVPFRLELMNTPLHYAKADTAVSMLTYARDYNKPTFATYLVKYTIGLPGTLMSLPGKLMGLFTKEDDKEETANSTDTGYYPLKPITLTKEEVNMLKAVAKSVSLTVEKKDGYLVLSVTGSEPLQTAELAIKAQQLLQEEVTRFRTEKAQDQLAYVQARYNEIKAETEALQAQLAVVRDRSNQMTTTRARIEEERIRSKYTISNAVFSEMAKQLEQAKMQVKLDTPMLTVIQPVTVPTQASNSRAKTLVIWVFMGIVIGCGIVLGKGYWPKVKEMFSKKKEEEDA